MENNKYFCPICGLELFHILKENPTNGSICNSCGFEFEYFGAKYKDKPCMEAFYAGYRTLWILNGKKWYFDKYEQTDKFKPNNWNPDEQLKNIIN